MKMRYGFNEVDAWAAFSLSDHRPILQRRLKLMGTKVVRIFVFDKPVADPFKEWSWFAAVLQGVLDIGAKPMITFAKFWPPFDSPRSIRKFVTSSTEIVWSCIEEWGGEEVKDWYWCIWNEPNNPDIGGDVAYHHYKKIYEETAKPIIALLEPHLHGQRAKIGGPSVDGTQRPYWMDWVAKFVNEVDNNMIGFVNWHMYADWRGPVPSEKANLKLWEGPDSPNGETFRSLAISHTPQYEARARGIAKLIEGRGIENICGELNAIAHHERDFTLGLNQDAFGAAYYASALIHLIRGGAELEMRWTATCRRVGTSDDAYGLMTVEGTPTAAGLAKQIFAQHVRCGDWVRAPLRTDRPNLDVIFSWNDEGGRSAVFVNTSAAPRQVDPADWGSGFESCTEVLRIDESTGVEVKRERFGGKIGLNGYGLAVLTNIAGTEID
jgi:hypothetical protein